MSAYKVAVSPPPLASTSTAAVSPSRLTPSARPAFGQSSPRFPEPPSSASHGVPLHSASRSSSPLPPIALPGLVGVGRALIYDDHKLEPAVLPEEQPLPSSRGNSLDATNPFFGGGSSRERMKASAASSSSGSGRVISGLQSDLLQARSAVDLSRNQLRMNQRAVEHLAKTNDDLKESRERLLLENEGLKAIITRKERLAEESLARTKAAEAALSASQESYRLLALAHKARLKEIEEELARSEQAKQKTEAEYAALRSGMSSMSENWKMDVDWVKADLVKLETIRKRDAEDARLKHLTLTKLFKAREANHAAVGDTLHAVQSSQHKFAESYRRSLGVLTREVEAATESSSENHAVVLAIAQEIRRHKRMNREAGSGESTS